MWPWVAGVAAAGALLAIACNTEPKTAVRELTVVVTPVMTTTPTRPPTAAEQYLNEIRALTTTVSERLDYLNKVAAAPAVDDARWKMQADEAVREAFASIRAVRAVMAPACMMDVHATILRATDAYNDAVRQIAVYATSAKGPLSSFLLGEEERHRKEGDAAKTLAMAMVERAKC